MGIVGLIFTGAILVGVPIAFVLGASALYYYIFIGQISLDMLGQKLYSGPDSFVLLAIPFFILAGELMNRAKIND